MGGRQAGRTHPRIPTGHARAWRAAGRVRPSDGRRDGRRARLGEHVLVRRGPVLHGLPVPGAAHAAPGVPSASRNPRAGNDAALDPFHVNRRRRPVRKAGEDQGRVRAPERSRPVPSGVGERGLLRPLASVHRRRHEGSQGARIPAQRLTPQDRAGYAHPLAARRADVGLPRRLQLNGPAALGLLQADLVVHPRQARACIAPADVHLARCARPAEAGLLVRRPVAVADRQALRRQLAAYAPVGVGRDQRVQRDGTQDQHGRRAHGRWPGVPEEARTLVQSRPGQPRPDDDRQGIGGIRQRVDAAVGPGLPPGAVARAHERATGHPADRAVRHHAFGTERIQRRRDSALRGMDGGAAEHGLSPAAEQAARCGPDQPVRRD